MDVEVKVWLYDIVKAIWSIVIRHIPVLKAEVTTLLAD